MLHQTSTRRCLVSIVALAVIWIFVGGCQRKADEPGKEASPAAATVPVRIGWQVAWATQGQLAEVLQHTNALELNGLSGDFKSFTYGAPLSEAALAGELDVAFVGDQPAINLISKSNKWKLVGRLMDFRVALVVPPGSPIREVRDLKGKTLGIPFGASTHRFALEALAEAGLDPEKDLKILNIDIQEQNDIVNSTGGKPWPKVDAFASWDHHIALDESKGLARILKSGTALGVVAMSDSFIKAHPHEATGFLAAFKLAAFFYATHPDEADKWFGDAAQGKFDLKILRQVAMIEPNMKAKRLQDVSIDLTETHLKLLQAAATFAQNQKLISQPVDVRSTVDLSLADQANKLLAADPGFINRLETKK